MTTASATATLLSCSAGLAQAVPSWEESSSMGSGTAFVGPQQSTTATGRIMRAPLYDPERIDISVGGSAQLTGTRVVTSSQIFPNQSTFQEKTQGATASAGVLATLHQQLTPWVGYNVNLGYSQMTEKYYIGTNDIVFSPAYTNFSNTQHSEVGTHFFEVSAAYVIKSPVATRRIQAFAQLGPAVLTFLPTQPLMGAVQFRAAALFGAGAEIRLNGHLGLRVEYRGLFYKSPTFEDDSAGRSFSHFTVSNVPAVSLVYRFGKHKSGMQ